MSNLIALRQRSSPRLQDSPGPRKSLKILDFNSSIFKHKTQVFENASKSLNIFLIIIVKQNQLRFLVM